jgi:4a-hydroxytetrahydrobiopterin dehydratase
MKKLDIKQAEPIRAKFTPDWEIRKGKYLYKKVAFDDYNQALEFLQMIKDPQIELDHFADIGVFYNELILMVYTHDVGGLTQLDFELALHIDEHLGHLNARTLDEEKKGLYHNVNKRKKAGTSRKQGHPKAPTDKAWKDAAKTAKENVDENFADGKKKGKSRPGRVKKSGASCNGSVTALRKRAKNASGEKAKMYHWCANMKSGRKKK